MIKRIRRGPPVAGTPDRLGGGKRSRLDDVQQPLVEQWKRQIIGEKLFTAQQRHLLDKDSPVHPASLDEINIVSRIGRLRLLWKRGWMK